MDGCVVYDDIIQLCKAIMSHWMMALRMIKMWAVT